MAQDTWWWNTLCLMHMDGANNGVIFTEEVFGNGEYLVGGNVVTSTSSPKYGTASAYFPGANTDWLRVQLVPDLGLLNADFAGGDFTIEGWFKANNPSVQYMTMLENDDGTYGAGAWALQMNYATNTSGDIVFMLRDYHATNPMLTSSSTGFDDNAWHHVAVTRNEDRWKLFVDGVVQASVTSSVVMTDFGVHWDDQISLSVAGSEYRFGNSGNRTGRGWNGYLDDWRITKGRARYTVAFTPTATSSPDEPDSGHVGPAGADGPDGMNLPGLPGDDGGSSVRQITLPPAPPQYDVHDQAQVRRLVEEAFR